MGYGDLRSTFFPFNTVVGGGSALRQGNILKQNNSRSQGIPSFGIYVFYKLKIIHQELSFSLLLSPLTREIIGVRVGD